ncbi:Narbonolide/10-deoxymethynolide synthase PikA1, modules 1 and 2 [Lasiodiplodia theobromae]|uniref:Narbonolide/10-deoxymethynolide synthase PikA1, modules 1 and 2 n=1 Tax=Lasiodiplodia theobromae TaxID=45133 RepID=A0A5N5DDV3_9PEZI|nr:Narbonolide/10-deoxymethynolide synthase PikA1, modules 1 and 2 [Lasiodiplodia theobromae]
MAESEDVGYMLARLNSMAFLAADAYTNQQHGRTQDVQSLFDSVFHLDSIRNILSRQSHSPTDLEYVVDIGEDEKLVVYGPDDGENDPPMPLLTTGMMGSALPVALEADPNYHAELVPDEIAEMLCGEAADGEEVSLDERLLAYIFDRIIAYAFAGSTTDWSAVGLVAFDRQNFHAQNLLSLQQRLLRGLYSPHNAQFELLFNINSRQNAGRDSGEVAISVALHAMLPAAVSRGSERLLLWNAALRVAAATPANNNTQQVVPALRPRYVDWVHVGDVPSSSPTHLHHNGRARHHFLLLQGSASGLIDDLHAKLQTTSSDVQRHDIRSFSSTTLPSHGSSRQESTTTVIADLASIASADSLPRGPRNPCRELCEHLATAIPGARVVLVTQGVLAVTGYEDRQVEADSLGAAELVSRYASSQHQLDVWQVDVDARAATSEGADALYRLLLLPEDDGSSSVFNKSSSRGGIVALRDGSRLFEPAWVESGRVVDAAGDEEALLKAPFAGCFREREQVFEMERLLADACTEALRSVVDPATFERAFAKLDRLAEQSLVASVASLNQQDLQHSVPAHLKQLCGRYSRPQHSSPSAIADAGRLQAELEELYTECPPLRPSVALLGNVLGRHRDVLLGRLAPLDVLFGKNDTAANSAAAQQSGGGGGAAEVYDEAVLARVHKRVVERTISHLCTLASSRCNRRLRILEVGAGTGGTALPLLRLLQQDHPDICAEYAFTDLGAHFVHAFNRRHGAAFPFLRTQTFDAAGHPSLQGFAAGEYDVVVCVNVLHATPSVAATLANVHALLAPGGALVLQEITTQASAFLDATFGLTEGWWAAESEDVFRPGGYPTLPPRAWQQALGRTGFAWSACTPAGGALDQQAVFVAQKGVAWGVGDGAIGMRLREESEGWYVLAGEQGDRVTALAAQELVGTFDARRLIWVRFGVGGAASYAQDEEDRAFQLAHEAGVDLQVFEGTRGSEIITPEVQSLLKGGDVRGVVWVTKDGGPQPSIFTALQQLHVDLDRLDRIPRRLVILHGIGYEGNHPLQDPLESFVRFRRGRLGLPTLLARWHLGEESGLPSAVAKSTIATAIRSCDFRSKKVAVLDFISAWKAARIQQQTTKTITTKASTAGKTVSGSSKSTQITNGVKKPTATRASNVPSIDTIIAVVIAEAEALLGSSGSVDADDPLMQAGIDSLAVVELRAGLKRLFPLAPLPSTYIYEYATARAIAEAIATMLAEVEEEQEEEAARAAPPSLTTAAPAVRDISLPATVQSHFPTTAPNGVPDILPEGRGNKIAVIAMDCRMPGGMNSSDEFWEGLKLGRDAMVDIPLSRFDVDEVYDGDVDALAKGKTYVRRGGFLDRAEHFDRSRFSIPEVQLQQMDPQQRILLETVDSALTDAGYSRKDMAGRDASVYIGVSCKDWAKVAPLDGAFIGTGAAAAIVSNRISFELGLSGTSMSIDTACSSSLVAVDLAVQALRLGRTDMAVAGGVNMILHPDPYVVFCQNKMLSPDGLCKTFDRDAKGYVRSEGCGVVILKRLSDALRDGDPVLGVITGSCSNQDGRSTNISAPSGKAQQEVVLRALRDAGRRPDEVDFVELHGTGTALGDPVEVHSLKAVFGAPTRKRKAAATDAVRTRPLYLGAVKTNIGHPEAAAGIAGLIKCVNVVQQRQVPPNIHLDNINPGIEFEGFEVARLPERVEDVGRGPDRSVVAGCSSFGFGGTNVHVIVESPPAQACSRVPKPVKKEVKKEIKKEIEKIPDVDVQRNTGTDGEEKLIIAFTGQGSQFASMAKELYRDDSVFAATLDRCVKICSPWIAPEDLRNALLEPNVDGSEAIKPAQASQASLFVMEYAIYQTLVERGLQADVVLGHSIGEIVAAVVSGCLSLEDGLRLVCQRGIIMEQADIEGTMYAIMLPHATIQAAIDELGLGETAAVAAINGSNLTTVAGLHESLQRLLSHLGQGVTSAPLKVSRPFHSPLLRLCMEEFAERIKSLNAGVPTTVRFWSTVTAAEVAAAPDVNHWAAVKANEQHFGKRDDLFEDGEEGECDPTGSNIVLVGQGRREGFFPWRRGYHALITSPEILQLDAETRAVRFRVNHRTIQLVADHVVRGRPILPGAAVFDLALGGYQVLHNLHPLEALPMELRDAVISRPVVLAADMEPPWLQLTYNNTDGTVQVMSAADPSHEFVEHARAIVVRVEPTQRHQRVRLATIQHRCTNAVDVTDLRSKLAARGLAYGPQFQAMVSAHRRDGECLAELRLPASGSSGYVVHPGVLDSAMQTCAATLSSMAGKDAFAVGSLGRLRVHAFLGEHLSNAIVRVWSRVVSSSADCYEANVDVCDALGNVLLSLEALRLVRVSSQVALVASSRCLYLTEWAPLQPAPGQSLSAASSARLPEKTAIDIDQLLGIVTGTNFARRGPVAALRDSLRTACGAGSLVDVVLPFTTSEKPIHTLLYVCSPTETAYTITSQLCRLFQAILDTPSLSELRSVVVVTLGSQFVLEDDACSSPESSAAWGLLRSARLELPQLRLVTLDVDPTASTWKQALAVLDAALDASEDEVAWRDGRRYVPRLTDPGFQGTEAEAIDLMRPAFDFSIETALPTTLDLNTVVPVDINDAELARVRTGYALVNSLALQSLIQGAASVSSEADVVPLVQQLWRRYRNMPASSVQSELVPPDLGDASAWIDSAIKQYPEVTSELVMLKSLYGQHGSVFRGERDPLELLFRTDRHTETEGIYSESFYARYYNSVVTYVLSALVQQPQQSRRKLRILEVGAGSGSTTRRMLETAAALEIEVDYHFTDISETFIRKASTSGKLSASPGTARITYGVFDAERDPRLQGLASSSFDLIVAVNVIHATRVLRETMANLRQLLRPRGVVVLSEFTRPSPMTDASFGMTEGWWRFDDKDLRPEYPLMEAARWEGLLLATGFDRVRTLENPKAGESQAVIVAQASCQEDSGSRDREREERGERGVYIISGGTGGIGLLTAIVLIERGCRKVYLLSRSGKVSSNSTHLWDRLMAVAQPDQVVKVTCDVSNGVQVAEVFAGIRERGEWVEGIIHSAGALRDAMLRNQTPATISTVFAAKVEALRHLHSCSLDEPLLRQFVIYSSCAALLGSPGQSNHAAANAFLDSFTAYRRTCGLPALSIQWGTVSGIGEAARKGANKLAVKFGHGQVSETEAESFLKAVFASDHTRTLSGPMCISPFNWSTFTKMRTRVPSLVSAFSVIQKAAPPRPTGSTPATKAVPMSNARGNAAVSLLETIQSCVEATVGTRMPSASSTFFDVGMDSLSAIEFRNRLQSRLGAGVKLSASLVFDYPTLARLQEYLEGLPELIGIMNETEQQPVAPPAPAAPIVETHPQQQIQNPAPNISCMIRNGPQVVDKVISIVGMDARLPGADTVEDLWNLLLSDEDPFRDIPFSRWDLDQNFYSPKTAPADGKTAGRSYVRQGSFLRPDQLEWFDNSFFGISNAEARTMDPNQRLLLEVSYQALADAGYTRDSLRGQNVGVFVGFMNYDQFFLTAGGDKGGASAFTASSASPAVLSNRVSHVLGLEGPSCTLDTACSASLYALHTAIGALRSGQCDAAVVAGVNVMMSPAAFVAECAAGMLSASQRCRPLDDGADGFARGEGCVAVVLQRRGDAVAQGRYIHADILGSSIGHDGTTVNLTSPNGPAQARVIQRALQDAGASPSSIAFVEGHLTGTVLGDPIEFSALKSVFGTPAAQENRSAPLHLGAIKSNLGHLEGVAGVAGLVKAVLSLRHHVLPPIAHLKKLNRHLDLEGFKVNVPRSGSSSSVGLVPSSSSGPELRCGVSSFGFSGANAHIVLEAPGVSQRCLVPRKRHVFSRNHFPLRRGGSHALIGRLPAVDSTLKMGGEHEVLIGHRLFALLEQHVVRGTPTVPGAMLVELAASVVASSGPSPSAHLQEIVFAAPFTVSAPRSKTMSIAHEADGQFTISWAGVDEEDDESHITAYGRLKGPADPPSADERTVMLDRMRRHQDACKQAVDIDSVWQKLEDVGIRYTGLFRSLQRAYTSINASAAALAYGYISLAENGEDGFLAHPALLDSAMQLCAAVVLAKLSTTEEQSRGAARTFLPFAMTGVRFWAPRPRESRKREFVAMAEVVSVGAAEVKARLSVFDDASDPVFDIEEIVFRPAGAKGGEQSRDQSQNKHPDPLHTVCWARMPTAPELEEVARPCVLVVEDEQDRDALASKLPPSVTVALRREHKASEELPQTLYYLPSLSSTAADLCASALDLVNTAVEAATSSGTPATSSLWILTRASQVAPIAHPQQAALWGLMRSVVLEDTRAVRIGLVDLVVASKSDDVLKLLGRLKAPSRPLSELAWDAGTDTWFAPQMVPDRLCELDVPTMAVATTGLDSLEAVPLIEPDGFAELGADQVSIRVGAVGINFHDVLFAAGGLQHGSSALGADFAGTVEAVGSGVKHVSPGDTVFGMAEACMRSVVRCNARLVRKMPEGLSMVDAASLPTVFATAHHCLVELAELRPGQTVLVHTATGGLGHLLISIARSRGAQVVVATAGSEAKRAYLRDQLGLESRMVSTTRDARAFAAELEHVAEKVDVAVNTLAGDYIPETLKLLKPGGTFIETGKVAIWSHDKVAAARPDVVYRVVDLDITGSASVELMDAFLSRLAEGVADGSVRPPPVTAFDYPAQLRDAFRYVRTAKHIGKVVLRMPKATLPRTIAAANTSPGFSQPEVPVTFDQSRYQEGIEQVAQFAARQLRAAAGSLAEDEVDGRWRKLYGRYAHRGDERAEDGKHLGVEEIIETWPEVRPEARLVGLMQGKVEDLFRGRVEAPTLLFSEAAMEVVEGFYVGSLALDYYNTVLKETLASLLRDRPSGRKLRILEVGAGTGATTAKLLPVLESVEFEYVFTDVSSVFLKKAKRDIANRLPANGSMVFDILDIEVDPCAQGFQPAQFDIVLAANCIHATRRMKETVANMRSLLRPSGAMLLFESTRRSAISDCTFGFTDGWWRFEDFDLRPDYPLLSFDTWNSLLLSNGFVSVDRADRLDGALESSAIIVARNSPATEDCLEDTSRMIQGDAAYLVTGGNSGLGLVAARALMDAGARHLVLLSRSGAIKEDDAHLWHQLLSAAANMGAKIEHLPCDVGDGTALGQTLTSLREQGCPEIRGVIHAAGLLDDAPFRQQSKKTLNTVIAPKVAGAISLRNALVPQPDFILLFSSAAGILGSPTQSNHCAANATLDALAAQWHHEGLPAMSLAWGMVLGLGTLRRQPPGRAAIERLGGISPDLAYRTICAAIAATAGCSHHSGYLLCSPIQWSKLLTSSDGTETDTVNSLQSGHRQLFSTYRKTLALQRQLEPKRKPARNTARSKASKSTSAAPKATQHAAAAVVPDLNSITTTIRSILADVTGTNIPSSEPDPRFEDHGVDSLSSMELGNRLNAAFPGLAISPMALNGFPTLSSLSQHVRQELLRINDGGNTTTAPEEQQQQQNLISLNAVPDDGHPDTPIAIVIHGGAGEVHHVKQLAARLPFRVVGVRQTDDVPAESVASMAAHYVRLLQREGLLGRRADGTVRRRVQLMGYSFGGCVAWEMARLLEMQHVQQPERLVLLDGGPTTDVSMEQVLGCRLEAGGGDGGAEEEGEGGVGARSIRLMGALLLASGAKVIGTADIVSTLQRVGLVKKPGSDDGKEKQQQQQQQSFDLDLISRTTRDVVELIPPSLRGAPLQRLTDLFAANMRAYDGYLAFHAAGKAPAFDGPVWVARSKLPRDEEERRRAQLWLDSDHYAFMDLPELAGAVAGLVVG